MPVEPGMYTIPLGQNLLARRWGAETVVFAALSGETHLLDNQSADILSRIEQSPRTYQDLKQSLAQQFDLSEEGVEEELDSYLKLALQQFLQLGLVEFTR